MQHTMPKIDVGSFQVYLQIEFHCYIKYNMNYDYSAGRNKVKG